MSIVSVIVTTLIILGVTGLLLLLFSPVLWIIFWINKIRLRKHIPDKIKMEVENERKRKEANLASARERYGRADITRDGIDRFEGQSIRGIIEDGIGTDSIESETRPVEQDRVQVSPLAPASKPKRTFKITKPKYV